MSILKKVLVVLVLVFAIGIGGFLAFASTRPDSYRVERSQRIDAPVEVVFAHIDNFKSWAAWSPWDKRDPAMKRSYDGPTNGVGAGYAWAGNKEVGQGRMTITESKPPRGGSSEAAHIAIRLEFIKPFASVATSDFNVKPEADHATTASWVLEGQNNLMGKAFGVFMNMDKMIGGDFESGLASLKAVAEAEARRAAAPAAPAQAVAAP
jgi:Polyketide cyclase / dehydrase and lipid transport